SIKNCGSRGRTVVAGGGTVLGIALSITIGPRCLTSPGDRGFTFTRYSVPDHAPPLTVASASVSLGLPAPLLQFVIRRLKARAAFSLFGHVTRPLAERTTFLHERALACGEGSFVEF